MTVNRSNCVRCVRGKLGGRKDCLIPEDQYQRIIQLLGADVSATVAVDCDELIRGQATRLRFVDGAVYDDRVVAEVQQRLHDEFIDTTWPACPEHPNHPLWLADGWWRCETSGTAVAALGQLSRRR